MEISKIDLKNLRYKVLRKTEIKGMIELPLPPYNPIEWAENSNSTYGPNYVIDCEGAVTQVLPLEYQADMDGAKEGYVMVYKANNPKADEAYKKLYDVVVKPHHTEQSEVSISKETKSKNKAKS